MNRTLRIVFYHPKEVANVEDILSLCREIGCKLVAVPRGSNREEVCKLVECFDDILAALSPNCATLVLETSGSTCIPELRESCINVVLGAEDYGLPPVVIKELVERGAKIVKIPMSRYGVSYNVVTALVLLLTEITISEHCPQRC